MLQLITYIIFRKLEGHSIPSFQEIKGQLGVRSLQVLQYKSSVDSVSILVQNNCFQIYQRFMKYFIVHKVHSTVATLLNFSYI